MKRNLNLQNYLASWSRIFSIAWQLLVAMSAFRLLAFFLLRRHFYDLQFLVRIQALFTGARFDLLILGFVFIPLSFILLACFLSALRLKESEEKLIRFWTWIRRFVKIYLLLAWIIMSYVYFRDLVSFAVDHHRLYEQDISISFKDHLENFLFLHGTFWFAILVLGWFIVSLSTAAMIIFSPSNFSFKDLNYSRGRLVLLVMIPFLMVALAARGKLGAHHLRREDAMITSNVVVHELVLNPLWTMGKHEVFNSYLCE